MKSTQKLSSESEWKMFTRYTGGVCFSQMKTIPLTQGKVALVDDEDFERVSQHKWFAHRSKRTFYAVTNLLGYAVRGGNKSMHRFIMDSPAGKEIDHINHDGLDNRKCNLRACTREENARNTRLSKLNTSGFKGVSLFKRETLRRGHPVWQAYIRHKGKHIHLGFFDDKQEAAEAYRRAAEKYFDSFAAPVAA